MTINLYDAYVNHEDHVALLREGVDSGGVWADLGSGTGAFALALADLLGPTGQIVSVDRDGAALQQQEMAMRQRFLAVRVDYLTADFTHPLVLPAWINQKHGGVSASSRAPLYAI